VATAAVDSVACSLVDQVCVLEAAVIWIVCCAFGGIQVTYDIVTEFEQMQKWDTMLQSMEVVERKPHQYPITRVGTFINTYGVPGM